MPEMSTFADLYKSVKHSKKVVEKLQIGEMGRAGKLIEIVVESTYKDLYALVEKKKMEEHSAPVVAYLKANYPAVYESLPIKAGPMVLAYLAEIQNYVYKKVPLSPQLSNNPAIKVLCEELEPIRNRLAVFL